MPIYIYKDIEGYEPNENTVVYYPLTSETTVNDLSWNWYTLTQNWNSDFWTYLWIDCVYVHWSDSSWFKCLTNQSINNSVLWNTFTLIFRWARYDSNSTLLCGFWWKNGSWNGLNYMATSSVINMEVLLNWSINRLQASPTINAQERNLFVAVYDNGAEKWFINTNQVVSGSYTVWTINVFWVWCAFGTETSWYTYQWNGYVSNCIIEKKARTAQEIVDYYNITKWFYWIS